MPRLAPAVAAQLGTALLVALDQRVSDLEEKSIHQKAYDAKIHEGAVEEDILSAHYGLQVEEKYR